MLVRTHQLPAVHMTSCSLLFAEYVPVSVCWLQAKEALKHPYFDDLDKVTVDALENPELEAFADN